MKFVLRNLHVKEKVLFEGVIHWIILLPGALPFIIGAGLAGSTRTELYGYACLALGVLLLFLATTAAYSSEIVITSRRLFLRFGFLRRTITAFDLNRIRQIETEQSWLGKRLGYKKLTITDIAGIQKSVPYLQNAGEFRVAAVSQIRIRHGEQGKEEDS